MDAPGHDHHAPPGLSAAADDDYCYLTTTGRVSGRAHEIEIWFALAGRTLYLLAGGGRASDWVRNALAEPSVSVRLRDVTYRATARVVEPATDEDAAARDLVFTKFASRYPGDLTGWRARALPVALDVEGPA